MRGENHAYKRNGMMTFEAHSASFAIDDVEFSAEPTRSTSAFAPRFASSEPEAGWATRNPARAMALLFVNPRDCAMVDELLA
jgi:hypothetical protein